MRVLFDHQIFTMQKWGGISRYFCELARELQAFEDVRTRIFAGLPEKGGLLQHEVDRGIGPVDAWFVPKVAKTMKARRFVGDLALSAAALVRPVDVFHPTYFFHGLPGRRGAKATVVTVYDMINELFPDQPERKSILKAKRASVDRADRILCISRKTAEDLVELFQVDPARIDITYLATRIADTPARGTRRDRPFVLYVGQRSGYKNYATLLAAYESTPAIHRDLDLVAFGGEALDPRDVPSKGRFAHVHGDDSLLRDLFEQAAVFVYPSRYEGFGLPPLEAMTLGCPVATTRGGSLPEVTGDAARYFEAESPESLAEAVLAVAGDATLRRGMIERGSAIAAGFSWARCARETRESYRKALASATEGG